MVIVIKLLSEATLEDRDFCDSVEITIDGETAFSVQDGEPEDNTLSRNFSDVFKITDLLLKVYRAGTMGEVISIIEEKV